MVKIHLDNIGKKYNKNWIFRGVNFQFSSEESYVILGNNGSGKSTLLKLIASYTNYSEGKLEFIIDNKVIPQNKIYKYLSICAPYLNILVDLTLDEYLSQYRKFKPIISNYSNSEITNLLELNHAKARPLHQFSSGMLQRVKLGTAILSDTPILMLDEPTSNLDNNAINWYQNMIKNYTANKLVLVASNQNKEEYSFCSQSLNINDFK